MMWEWMRNKKLSWPGLNIHTLYIYMDTNTNPEARAEHEIVSSARKINYKSTWRLHLNEINEINTLPLGMALKFR